MKTIFADTSFHIAVVSPRDGSHSRAIEFADGYSEGIITTEQVLTEAGNWFARTGDRELFLDLIESVRADLRTTVIWSERIAFEAGLRLYEERRDKDWSLTDCISFVVMKERGLTEALTADHHFEQAGFTALLK